MNRKSIVLFILIAALLSAMFVVPANAEQWPLSVRVNDEEVIFPDALPFIDSNGRTQVPVRFVSEALMATVDWIGETRQVSIKKDGTSILLTLDKKEMIINGETKVLDSAPLLKEGRTFVPIRFVSEGLGAYVDYEGLTNTVFIDTVPKSSSKLEYITSSEVEINGVKIAIEPGDDASTFGEITQIIKKSELSIIEPSDETVLLYLSVSRGPNADYDKEMNEVKELISRTVSPDIADKVYSYCEKFKEESDFHEEITGGPRNVWFNAPVNGPITIYILK